MRGRKKSCRAVLRGHWTDVRSCLLLLPSSRVMHRVMHRGGGGGGGRGRHRRGRAKDDPEPKVAQLQSVVLVQQDIVWLKITVKHAHLVAARDRCKELSAVGGLSVSVSV